MMKGNKIAVFVMLGLAVIMLIDKYFTQTDPVMKALSGISSLLYIILALLFNRFFPVKE